MDLVVFSVAIVIFYFVVWKNPKFQEWIKQPFGEGGETPAEGGTGGAGAAGTCGPEACMYKVLESVALEESTPTRNYASGGSSPSYEAEVNKDWEQYAIVWYGNIGQPDDDSDELTIKMNGDGHSDGNCCWYAFGIAFGGETYFGAEKEHPSDNVQSGDSEAVAGPNIGPIASKDIGIQVVFNRATAGQAPTIEAYTDTGSGWVQAFPPTPDPGGFGWTNLETPQNILVRIDNASQLEKAKCAQVHLIDPSAKQTPSTAPAPTGGAGTPTTPAPTTPNEEEEENGNEEEEDEEANLAYAYSGLRLTMKAGRYKRRTAYDKENSWPVYSYKDIRKNPAKYIARNRMGRLHDPKVQAYNAKLLRAYTAKTQSTIPPITHKFNLAYK